MKKISVLAAFAAVLCSCGTEQSDPVIIPVVYPDKDTTTTQVTVHDPYKVEAKKSVSTANWTTYEARTVECIEGFTPTADPEVDKYGGWTIMNLGNESGFFQVRQAAGRWWLVDPLGNIFLSKAVAVFSPGGSERQKNNVKEKYGSEYNWAKAETSFLREQGFNSVGAWSAVGSVKSIPEPIPYTVIVSPMSTYNGYLKKSTDATLVAAYKAAGWEGYPYDFAMVFDDAFDSYVENSLKSLANYKDDKYCIGYFIDNEIPWKQYAIDRCLQKWPSTHINHIKAQQWLDERKGKAGCTISDVTDADRKAFIAYCFETYLKKVTTVAKKYDPNHLFLGCRFNQWNYELVNDELFKVAGKYMDIISINHYQKWQPDQTALRNWATWSGRPFFITEFYTKGYDTIADGLANTTGAGWLVKTQNDRGLFYENFVNELLKCGVCVGWHWFTYMDNDPTNTSSDSSNLDSNKGIVKWNTDRYDDLIKHMSTINGCTYNLARFYDKQ